MKDNRVIALFFLSGWRVQIIAKMFGLTKGATDKRISSEARKIGARAHKIFRQRADKYRAMVEREGME